MTKPNYKYEVDSKFYFSTFFSIIKTFQINFLNNIILKHLLLLEIFKNVLAFR